MDVRDEQKIHKRLTRVVMKNSNIRPIKSAFQSGDIIDIIRRLDGIKIDPVRLHYYEKTGLIKASVRPAQGCGKHKLYSFSDLVMLRWFLQLRKQGLSMQKVRKGISYLRKNMPKYIERPFEHELFFVTDGQDMFALVNGEDAISLVRTPGQKFFGVMVYDFKKMIEDTREAIARAA
jgi:DNA-binding transcriptional MerR regulator